MTRRKNKLISILLALSVTLMVPLQLFASFSIHNASISTHNTSMFAATSHNTAQHKTKDMCNISNFLMACDEHQTCHNDSCKTSASCSSSNSLTLFREVSVSAYRPFSQENAPYTAGYIADITENPLLRPPISS